MVDNFERIIELFDKSKFKIKFPDIDIHYNNPTVLFSP